MNEWERVWGGGKKTKLVNGWVGGWVGGKKDVPRGR